MSAEVTPLKYLDPYIKMVRDHWLWFQYPVVAIGALGTLVALFHGATWQASQTLIVRDEAVGELSRYGRFDTNDARKAAQETVLQMARQRQVVSRALQQMMPADKRREPSDGQVRALESSIHVTAPKGAELGQSDVLYLVVKGRSEDDAKQRATAVCDQLDRYLKQLRRQRATSLIQELTEKLKLTQANLNEASGRLEVMEREVGSDLGELRTLNQSGTGESTLRNALNQIKNDARNARATLTAQQELLSLLKQAEHDPKTLVATPTRLLDSQPALKRLREGLVDAQLRVADLLGKMHESHPSVRAAQKAESEIREHVYRELATAIRSTEADLQLTKALLDSHEKQCQDVQTRLDRLAGVRARYEILVADVQDRSSQVKNGQRALAEANASLEAADTSSLLTRVGHPETGDGPLGPGRMTIFLGGWLGGALVGLGVVFLVASSGERIRDSMGRRWSDRSASSHTTTTGRRATDPVAPGSPVTTEPAKGRRASDQGLPPRQPLPVVPTNDLPSSPPSMTS